MSERLTESERQMLVTALHEAETTGGFWGEHPECQEFADVVAPTVERILADRLAARGAGDGLAAELLAHLWTCPLEAFACTDPIHAEHAKYALDPDAQGADEGGSRG